MGTTSMDKTQDLTPRGPRLNRSVTLNFQGPESQVGIWNIRHGGIESVINVYNGRMNLAIATPAQLITTAIEGKGIFSPFGPMPSLRALGVLPQNDRVVFAIHPKHQISTFEELRAKKPAIQIATSTHDGTNFIGYVAHAYLASHGISPEEVESWGGSIHTAHRPEQALELVVRGEADVFLQEAIMTPWWQKFIEEYGFVPLPAESAALTKFMADQPGATRADAEPLPAGFWKSLSKPLPCLDFSDFVVLVRDDLPDDIAYLLTWCLVETRGCIEAQYRHLPPQRSPLSYPLDPRKMAQSPVPLHPAARRYYSEAGHL